MYTDEGLSGKELYSGLYKSLTADLKLDVLDCRGQGYDGAGAVSGRINGLSAHFLKINDKAVCSKCHGSNKGNILFFQLISNKAERSREKHFRAFSKL